MGAKVLVVDDSTTLRKLVSSILLDSGFEPTVASSAEEALESLRGDPVELVLLDYVLPGMNGLAFCQHLHQAEDLKDTPVVLMSAKGDTMREQFIRQSGAIDAITKPFDPRGLVAVVEGALKRAELARNREEEAPSSDSAPDSVRPSVDPDSQARPRRELTAGLVDVVVRELEATINKSGGGMPTSMPELAELVRSAVGIDSVSEMLAAAGVGPSAGHVALSGDLSVVSIAEVLQLLHMQRQTGAVEVTGPGGKRVTLFLNEGNVDLAASRGLGREFLFGRYLVERGSIGRPKLGEVLSNHNGERLLGDVLIELGLTTKQERAKALEQQTCEIIYELVRWQTGRFTFVGQASSPASASAALGLMPSGIIMEGFRRVDEWRLIEGSFDFDEVLVRDETAIRNMTAETALPAGERAVLAAIDGERTVREIVEGLGGGSFSTCKILYQFLNSRLVRREAA